MKLLVCTQTVDAADPVLGFFHAWIAECARQCDKVTVICLKEGTHALPANVRVVSLGKETHPSRLRYVFLFYKYICTYRHDYDTVFVHMNPEYVVLGGLLWRMMGKRVSLWYTHGTVTRMLCIATRLTHVIFTASKESFRIPSPKVRVVGHGIDTNLFRPSSTTHAGASYVLRLVTVGRVSRTKRQDLALATLLVLLKQGSTATLTIVGTPLTDADRAFEAELQATWRLNLHVRTGDEDALTWRGAVSNQDLPNELAQADILLHTSETGSLDKVVLEALASGVMVVTTSDAVRAVLPPTLAEAGYAPADPQVLAQKIAALVTGPNTDALRREGRAWVERHHALPALIAKILGTIAQ